MASAQYNTVIDQICAGENLEAAWVRTAAKGSAGGIDGESVAEFARGSARRLEQLRADLADGGYLPAPLREVRIPKPSKPGETRALHLPTVRDKVAQEAVRRVLEPILDCEFLDCSYGYRPGKGARRALGRVRHVLEHQHRQWIVKADIDNFFDSIDHARLLEMLGTKVQDPAVIRLVGRWLKGGLVDARARWHDVRAGVAQGSVLSPLLANLYLDAFDRHVTAAGYDLVRYADDFVILCMDRAQALTAFACARAYLRDSLALTLNPDPQPVVPYEQGFVFLGVRHQPGQRTLDGPKRAAMIAQATRIARDEEPIAAATELVRVTRGWRNYYGRLLDEVALAELQGELDLVLASLGARGLAQSVWRNAAAAAEALLAVPAVTPTGEQLRRQRLLALLARPAAAEPETQSSRRPPSAAGPRAAARRRLAPKSAPRETEATAMRRVKRRYARDLAAKSELVLDTPGSFLGKQGDTAVMRYERRVLASVPLARLSAVTVAGAGIAFSSDIVIAGAERGLIWAFLGSDGKLVAVLQPPPAVRGDLALRHLEAVQCAVRRLQFAATFVRGKLHNQEALLKYCFKSRKGRDCAMDAEFGTAITSLRNARKALVAIRYDGPTAATASTLFGIEGRAAQAYWSAMACLLPPRLGFPGRRHQGASDVVNAMLNYGYAVLSARVELGIVQAGLIPQLSFLHALRERGEASLGFDLMEEFRPCVVDRTVLSLVARREPVELDADSRLTAACRARLLERLQERLSSLVRHRGQDLKLDEVIRGQAQELAAEIAGTGTYRPYLARW